MGKSLFLDRESRRYNRDREHGGLTRIRGEPVEDRCVSDV